ncbi:MAG: hypothetical protein U1E45_21170 [Geminicoccaceae bacterium]
MPTFRAWLGGLFAVPLTIIALQATAPAVAAERIAGTPITLRAGPSGFRSFVQPDPAGPRAAATATFNVTYVGFSSQARTAFQRAVDIWAQKVRSPVPITIRATYRALGTGILGSAGPSFVWRDFPGAPRAGTWYVDALANKLRGSQLDSGPDIVADFSSAFPNWHFGSGAAPANTYDFTSVVLHEIGHGLGFLGFGNAGGSQGSIRLAGLPSIFDRFTENSAGKALTSFADPSVALRSVLLSNSVFFDSTRVRAANGNVRARLYAPAAFQPGSSYSHLDENTYGRGNVNSLMTPFLGQAETIRSPGPIVQAIFGTLGW